MRRTLVEQIQMEEAQKFISAEVQALQRDGELHPGFSSIYGRMNGIWRNRQALAAGADYLPSVAGIDE